jgi:pilus assembly protein CpaC
MKKIILLVSFVLSLLADDIVVFNNEYNILTLDKKVKKLIVGNKDMINVSLLSTSTTSETLLKIFGKTTGNTSILIMYRDGSIQNYHVYVNQNLGFIEKMINTIEPNLHMSKVGDGSTVISGTFENPHDKKRIYALLESAGVNLKTLMDLTETKTVNKMVRTKLYLVQINNQKAEDMGGVTGLGFFSDYIDLAVNPLAANGATFSGWLLDNTARFTSQKGKSVNGTLNFLVENGIGKVLDDTVLMTTEDENASFRVGGEVYIPTGIAQNQGFAPTILVEEKEYGLELKLKSDFMEKDGFIHINVNIEDSEFDSDATHDVQLGDGVVIPAFISKNIDTNVVVKSGQVIVLGGRLHTENTDREEKVPFLGDIPLLGELFKHTVTSDRTNDLLFFLVPEIVDANENIDDTHFYEEFKKDAKNFHKEVLDFNSSKNEPLVVLNDTNVTKEDVKKTILEDDTMLIEVEDNSISTDDTKNEVIVAEEENEATELEKPISKYSVLSEKIFLREKPLTGKRVLVWSKGHQFIATEEESVNGSVWLKIKEDCSDSCSEVSQELWISKKYTVLL